MQTLRLITSADAVNKLHTTEAVDSIVDEYLTNGDGTNTGKLDAAASIDGINLTQETANLTVNVSFPNAVVNQAAAYQNMKVTVSGNGANEVVKLGEVTVVLHLPMIPIRLNLRISSLKETPTP